MTTEKRGSVFIKALLTAVLALAACLVLVAGSARAAVQYLNDGAVQDATSGAYDLPQSNAVLGGGPGGPANLGQGYCYPDVTKLTRPECTALRYPYATSALCTADATGYGAASYSPHTYQGVNVSPNVLSFSTGVCNYPDAAGSTSQAACTALGKCSNVAYTTQATCVTNGAIWSQLGVYTNGVCGLSMKGDDRNKVTCFNLGGTWVTTGICTGTWVMPNSSTYNPPLFTGTTSPGPGDQCLRCHNSITEWNVNRARDVNSFLLHGHKNMSRRVGLPLSAQVVPGSAYPWSGPPFNCTNPLYTAPAACQANGAKWVPSTPAYPTDSTGHAIDWVLGNISVNSISRQLYWIYGGWGLDGPALPGAIYSAPPSATHVCSNPLYTTQGSCTGAGANWVLNAGVSYSCARCHTTGWTSDAAIGPSGGNLAKEPEKSFPGITWPHITDATTGVVNLADGVTGDPNNLYASWDLFGVSCTRCHSSAVENTSNGGVPPYSAATGQSSHHNALDTPDAGSGYCTDPRFTAQAQCTGNGGVWMTACSDGVSTTQAACQAIPGNTWFVSYCTLPAGYTFPVWWTAITGVAINAAGTNYHVNDVLTVTQTGASNGTVTVTSINSGTGAITGLVVTQGGALYRTGTNLATTVAPAGGTGATVDITSVGPASQGNCSNSSFTTAPTCVNTGHATWTNLWATDIDSCEDAGGKWTGSKPIEGQIITSLCMQCHRQETGGLPYTNGTCSVNPATNTNQSSCLSNGGAWTETGNGLPVRVGPSASTVSFGNHPQGNEELNSPHGLFTGKFSQIATGTVANGIYKSFFLSDGEAANTGNGCVGCHNIHKSVVQEANPDGGALVTSPAGFGGAVEACNDCHHKNLGTMLHPKGAGTPLASLGSDPTEACATCHMPGALHLFRINTDPNYSTFPAAALTANTNANTMPDGTFANAVWVDLDAACGQCHGGGTQQASTTLTAPASTSTLSVASTAGFQVGQRITVAGAGSFQYDDPDVGAVHGDFSTYVVSIGANTLTVVGAPPFAVASGAVVGQNPVMNNAAYLNKTQLAGYAKGIHNDAPANVNFGYTLGHPPNTLMVNVFAQASCNGPCNVFDWNWGDGKPDTSGGSPSASHTYAAAGAYQITLTVTQFGFPSASVSKIVNVYAADLAPTALGMTCATVQTALNTGWAVGFTDSSTDDNGISQVTVTWGDGSLLDSGGQGTMFGHTYRGPGTYIVTHKALDTIGQQNIQTCVLTAKYFTISGTVKKSSTVSWATGTCTVSCATQAVCTAAAGSDPPGCGGTWNSVASQCENPVGTPFPNYTFASATDCTLLSAATVTVKDSTTLLPAKTTFTAANGTFSAGSLKPGSYNITVTKSGYTFNDPANSTPIMVGPSSTGNTIQAIAP